LALVARLPTIYGAWENVAATGLISYGPDLKDLFRRAGDDVDQIAERGPPVAQPTKFELVTNFIAAMALGKHGDPPNAGGPPGMKSTDLVVITVDLLEESLGIERAGAAGNAGHH